jgi:hypothetical protein
MFALTVFIFLLMLQWGCQLNDWNCRTISGLSVNAFDDFCLFLRGNIIEATKFDSVESAEAESHVSELSQDVRHAELDSDDVLSANMVLGWLGCYADVEWHESLVHDTFSYLFAVIPGVSGDHEIILQGDFTCTDAL